MISEPETNWRNLSANTENAESSALDRNDLLKNLKEPGTIGEPWGNRIVSDWKCQHQLGKLGDLDPVESDRYFATYRKPRSSHLIWPAIEPILLLTHPLHHSWKRSRALSMTCIIGGSFFLHLLQILGLSCHTRPRLIEVQR